MWRTPMWHARLQRLGLAGWGLLAPLLAVGLGVLVFLWNPLPVQILRYSIFDQYQRWQPRDYTPAPVHIIDIDDESLQRLGQWPWPRTRIAELTARLQDAQAAAIAFDILFSESDRTSPPAMLELWSASAPVRDALSYLPDHDAALAAVISRGNVVLGFSLDRQQPLGNGAALQSITAAPRYVTLGEPAQPFVNGFSNALTALPLLQAGAAGQGALTFVPDSDGVVRRVPLLLRVGDTLVPTLTAEALRVAQGAKNYITRTASTQGVGLEELRVGRLTIPTTPSGEVWVYYSRPVPARYIPAWKVLAGEVPAETLNRQILLVGASAQGLMDLRFSPLGQVLPGVEVHAQLLEQVLTGGGLVRPSWAAAREALVLIGGGLLVGGVALASGALLSFGVVVALLALLWASAWWAFSNQGMLLDPVLPSLVIGLSFVLSSIVHHFTSERRQAWVKQAFARYVSPNLVTHLIDHPDALELGGKRQQCSFVFTDLAGFTRLMEQMDPGEAVTLLNVYLDRMIAIAFSHEGTLDRIVGDAVAIMFSAPLPQPDHQRRALACALEMQRFAGQYEFDLKQRGVVFCNTRIGVHSGEVIVGNFGGSTMFDYRALGDPVNTASRLEGANKQLGTLVCVSEATLSGCPEAPVRPVGRLLLQGKTQALRVFEPLDASDPLRAVPLDDDYIAAYGAAFKLLQEGHADALNAFEALLRLQPGDALAQLHLSRLHSGEWGDLIVLAQK